jgi:phosphoribosylanthranilate isomerase
MEVKIKAGKISNLTDARYFAAQPIQWIGFNLDASSGSALSFYDFLSIREWIEGPEIIAELGFVESHVITRLIKEYNMHHFQLSPLVEIPRIAKEENVQIIRELVLNTNEKAKMVEKQQLISGLDSKNERILLNCHKAGVDWSALSENQDILCQVCALCETKEVILAIDFDIEQLPEMVRSISPFGIQLEGGEEEKTEFKSFEELDRVFSYMEYIHL